MKKDFILINEIDFAAKNLTVSKKLS